MVERAPNIFPTKDQLLTEAREMMRPLLPNAMDGIGYQSFLLGIVLWELPNNQIDLNTIQQTIKLACITISMEEDYSLSHSELKHLQQLLIKLETLSCMFSGQMTLPVSVLSTKQA